MKHREFPENPFLMTFSKIVMIDAVVAIATVALAIWKEDLMWYTIFAGVVIAIAVFVVLNKRCLRQLSCPKCNRHVAFEAGSEGFVCKNCNTVWEMG
ncbi:MAG: hypothetical protein COB41_01635 [Proteobacteria bacterium]|nr:MAG: hypothetical protein COB41_01635 [Pseudomonadota bacterium]